MFGDLGFKHDVPNSNVSMPLTGQGILDEKWILQKLPQKTVAAVNFGSVTSSSVVSLQEILVVRGYMNSCSTSSRM